MTPLILLFFIIITEGYVVLATELLAIRQATPFIGNGTDTISIIIAAVLMPLASGYYYGGRFRPGFIGGRYLSIRRKLSRNIIIAALFLLPGLSYYTVNVFFFTLLQQGIDNRIILTALYCLSFLVVPVFLLGQTVPLISNYFSQEKLSVITGKMLFCSTVGSFLGAILSSLILMNIAGVHNAVNVIFLLLAAIIFAIGRNKFSREREIMLSVVAASLVINSGYVMRQLHVVSNNSYNTINVLDDVKGRHLLMNNSDSSLIGPRGEKHPYIEFIERHYLKPILRPDTPVKRILVVGSAGFTFGLEDAKNAYVYVDIDPAVKNVAENDFLRRKLTANKKFIAQDIRSYLMQSPEKFDLILLDAYLGGITLPEPLLTQEFFMQLNGVLNDNGILAANFVIAPNFAGAFSQKLDNTFRSVFPQVMRQSSDPDFDGWRHEDSYLSNIIYVYHKVPQANVRDIYTDDKHPIAFDKPVRNNMHFENPTKRR